MKVELQHELAVASAGTASYPSLKLDGEEARLVQKIEISLDAESQLPEVLLRFIPQQLDVLLTKAIANSDLASLAKLLSLMRERLWLSATDAGACKLTGAPELATACQGLSDMIANNGEPAAPKPFAELWAQAAGIIALRVATLQAPDKPWTLARDAMLRGDEAGQRTLSFVAEAGYLSFAGDQIGRASCRERVSSPV